MTITNPTRLEELRAAEAWTPQDAQDPLSVHPLTDRDESEVLTFLAERPLHTVVMAGHIRDNGMESPLNRGTFHAARDGRSRLEGVALIGHATLVESRSEAALAAFARLAQSCQTAHLMMGEQEKIERFWCYYASPGQRPRRVCRELLMEQRWPVEALEPVARLRHATLADLGPVMHVQAEMAQSESGVNPLEADPEGFRLRCARRVEQGRVWVWTEGGQLIFKADVISDTPEVIYLEGVHVDARVRGLGYGARCVSQLSRTLLARTNALCVLVNEQSQRARSFFERAGYKLRDYYDTVFLERGGGGAQVLS
ncbi:MAG TPA: GNAT family N-acetyltransferase [Pyrinomonadaceae bacterium]|nr:GNAT family N-acetyltransferase [Pyrinomonadaceae bacterium]